MPAQNLVLDNLQCTPTAAPMYKTLLGNTGTIAARYELKPEIAETTVRHLGTTPAATVDVRVFVVVTVLFALALLAIAGLSKPRLD